jgi:cobalt-precorrin-5B (C1)-methyltransferase
MRDPVNGFEYPESWGASCRNPELLPLVEAGLAVLTSDGSILRRGFSTGTTAAAACKAAVLSLATSVDRVAVTTPSGLVVQVPVSVNRAGSACCRKYAGDYPDDATAGILMNAEAVPDEEWITFHAGEGIGRLSRDTPRFSAGEPAISHPAMGCIMRSIAEGVTEAGLPGVRVDLSIPSGTAVAEKTLNPRLGITGGISILGTTGFVEPWDDHLFESVLDRVGASDRVVLTTGRIGMRYARLLFPDHETVLVGSRIGNALASASGEVVICGLPGLIVRFIMPEILDGTGYSTVEEMAADPGSAAKIESALDVYRQRYPGTRVVLIDREGKVIYDTDSRRDVVTG